MTNEETLADMMLETCVTLEFHNLLEFAPFNVIQWYYARKQESEQDFNPAEKMILDRAAGMKK